MRLSALTEIMFFGGQHAWGALLYCRQVSLFRSDRPSTSDEKPVNGHWLSFVVPLIGTLHLKASSLSPVTLTGATPFHMEEGFL